MGGGGDEDESRAAAPRASLKTINNYSNWKQKLRETCCRRIRDDRTRLLWRMRSLPNNNNNNINHSSSFLTHQEATFIQSALQGIVSDELTINDDLLWEYDGLRSQPECEDILLEMQNIFYQDLELRQTTQRTSWEDDEDNYLARLVYQHMQLNDGTMEMEPYEIVCKCGEGKMICKRSNSETNRNRMYYICPKAKKTATKGKWDWGCKYFLWEDELTQSSSRGFASQAESNERRRRRSKKKRK